MSNLSKNKKGEAENICLAPSVLFTWEITNKSVCPFGGCVNSTLQICLCQQFLNLSDYGCYAFGNAPAFTTDQAAYSSIGLNGSYNYTGIGWGRQTIASSNMDFSLMCTVTMLHLNGTLHYCYPTLSWREEKNESLCAFHVNCDLPLPSAGLKI